ncbi:MAG: DNA polymerase III subunit chi [Methylohalobius sp. ZOD2]
MTRVDFYLLPGRDSRARHLFACRLTEKAYRMEHNVFLRTADSDESRVLDDLLWTFRQGSFVPHTLTENRVSDPLVPAAIGADEPPEAFHQLLINLNPELPTDWHRFERIAEILTQDDATRTAGRQKYRVYQQQGAELHVHRIEST